MYTYEIDERVGVVRVFRDGKPYLCGSFGPFVSVASKPRYRTREKAEEGDPYRLLLLVIRDDILERGLVSSR